jgi:hypothetical protein
MMERRERRRAYPGRYIGFIMACLALAGILVVGAGCNKYADDFTQLNILPDLDKKESSEKPVQPPKESSEEPVQPPVDSVLKDLDMTPREADPIIPREPPKPASEVMSTPPVESVLKDLGPIIPGTQTPLPLPALPSPPPFTQTPLPLPTLKPGQLAVPLVMSADIKGTATGVVVTLGVDYQAHITGAPSVKVTRMILKVNGETWADSGTLAVSDFTNVVTKQVAPGQTYNAQVTVSTSDGSNNVATSSLVIPKP